MQGIAKGKRGQQQLQEDLWVATADIVETPGHALYAKLEQLHLAHRFDQQVEHLCRRSHKGPLGQPSLPPGVYFRSLLIGFFEGHNSESASPGASPIRSRSTSSSDMALMSGRPIT